MSPVPRFPKNDPNIVYETIEGETVLVNLKSGSYYSLVGVGSVIWTELEAGRTPDEILTRLNSEYDGNPREIETAVRELLESLVREDLLIFETPDPHSPRAEPASVTPLTPPTIKREFRVPHLQKFTDMQELLLLDPVHEADETGWPLSENREPA